ncbi:hypothetical protein [Massilia sp. Mn16-1_5]|uniref:hypothetical protein n=1 Tax=Massilia sp. Mn16-1_5 TaxID=2079199 RepID=UPI00109E8266|nr:hypothetical protein [Massilia sp. Mn16-1_5]
MQKKNGTHALALTHHAARFHLSKSLAGRETRTPATNAACLACLPSIWKLDACQQRRRTPSSSAAGKKSVSAVDKPLHIHRMRCAERRLVGTRRFFSNIDAGSIQSLSSFLRYT